MSVREHRETIRLRIAALFGDTADLSEELVNTLCNLYYFAEVGLSRNLGGLSDLQRIHDRSSPDALLPLYLEHMAHVAVSVHHAPDLVKSLREVRSDPIGKQMALSPILERITCVSGKHA